MVTTKEKKSNSKEGKKKRGQLIENTEKKIGSKTRIQLTFVTTKPFL